MEWNWGTKLFIAIVLFMSLIIGFVIFSLQHDVSLVEKDYYPKGQVYQTRLDQTKNAVDYRDKFVFQQTNEHIILNLPVLNADTASINFFRPSDISFDKLYDISSGDSIYGFPLSDFIHGKYQVKVFWQSGAKGYYFEREFFFE